jgi:hypothetical protein
MARRLVRTDLTILLTLAYIRSHHFRSHFFNLRNVGHQIGVSAGSFNNFEVSPPEVVFVAFIEFFKRTFLFVEIFVDR